MNGMELRSLIAAYKPQKEKPKPRPRVVVERREPRVRRAPANPHTAIVRHTLYAYGIEPICPRCSCVGFDDWWHVLVERKYGRPSGRLKCGLCEKVFFIKGIPGDITSTAYGLDQTDILMRQAGL